jgi:very-short-patch-repair endonuclease
MADREKLLENARQLRRQMTYPERLLWHALRNRNLAGIKLRRQVPLLSFIADFLCDEHSLIVELDGNSHTGRHEYDIERQSKLEQAGFRILRFGNDDVLQDLDAVLRAILLACGKGT